MMKGCIDYLTGPSEGAQRRAVAKAAVLSPEENRAAGERRKMSSI